MGAHAPAPRESDPAASGRVFDRVLVGIDETPESLVAAAQAGVLRAPGGELVLLAVAERHLAAHAGPVAPRAEKDLVASTASDLERARELVDADAALLASGRLVDQLCAACASRRTTLVAIGARPHRRLSARTFGGPDVDALRAAPCSVLVARAGWGPSKPDRIVVPVDGSAEARVAETVARGVARRLERDVVPVVALAGDVDLALLRAERNDALLDPGTLTEAVARAASRRSLVVVGRAADGRRRARNRVERLVYSAECSILVVSDDAATNAGG